MCVWLMAISRCWRLVVSLSFAPPLGPATPLPSPRLKPHHLHCPQRGSSIGCPPFPSGQRFAPATYGHTYAISQPYFVDSAIDRSYLPDRGNIALIRRRWTQNEPGGRGVTTTTSSCWLVEAERAARSRSPAPVTPAQSRTNSAPTKPPKRPAAAHVLVAARGALAARRRCRG
jgi:hypothetical protein